MLYTDNLQPHCIGSCAESANQTLFGEPPPRGGKIGNGFQNALGFLGENGSPSRALCARRGQFFFKFVNVVIIPKSSDLLPAKSGMIARAERVVALTKILRTTNAPPASAPLRRGRLGKIFLCFSDLRATDFSFKKEKEILPRCSALKNSGGRGLRSDGAGIPPTPSFPRRPREKTRKVRQWLTTQRNYVNMAVEFPTIVS